MRPLKHFVSSVVAAIIFFIFSGRLGPSLVLFLAGFFIDLDHLIDYWALKPAHPFSLKDFLDSEKYDKQKKYVFIFFHSWELVLFLWIIIFSFNAPLWFLALAIGATLHLLLDTSNILEKRIHFFGYFFVLRLAKGFKK